MQQVKVGRQTDRWINRGKTDKNGVYHKEENTRGSYEGVKTQCPSLVGKIEGKNSSSLPEE